MLNLFCGYDQREAPGYHVFCASVLHRASIAVAFTPLHSRGRAEGSNAFTMSRFMVPWLMGYKGRAVFADAADMVCLEDVRKLQDIMEAMSADKSVLVVPHAYKTRNRVKYIGTPMESPNTDYPRKNWASLMVINCEHPAWREAHPDNLTAVHMGHYLELRHLPDESIGRLEDRWNVLVDEGQDPHRAAILHWTAGIPGFEYYKDALCADIWRRECLRATSLFHTE
jgi:hypothetical protein